MSIVTEDQEMPSELQSDTGPEATEEIKELKMEETELALEDQLSDAATINFYRRYFLEEEGERNYDFTLEPTAGRKL